MSHYTRGIAQSITRGGTSLNIDSTDPGSLLIGNNSGSFDLNQLTAGSGVSITNGSGTITISATGSTYTLPIASVSILGGIKVGANLSIDGTGILSGAAPYTLPIASGSVLGGIKVGSGLSIDGSGVLSTAVISDATTTVSGIVEVDRNASANPHPIAYTREGLAQTPVIDVTRGLLSLGGSPFDGTSVGHFVGGSFGNDGSTLIAVNLPSSYSGNVLDFQLIGVNFLNLDTTPNLVLTGRFSGLFSNGINNLQGAVEPGRLSVAGSPTSLISDSNILGFAILTNSRQQASYWVARTNSESALTCNARPRQSDSAWVRSMSPNGASAVGLDEGTIKLRVFAAQAASTITWTDALTINSAGVVTLSSPLGTASGGTGVDSSTAANGQLLIGTGSGLALATLTAGSNVTITNASGGITIALPSSPTVTGEVTASDFKPSGLTGATAASRYVGGTASGAPASGTFAIGDFVVDQTGKAWVCTSAGTPGTWAQLAGSSGTAVVNATTITPGIVLVDHSVTPVLSLWQAATPVVVNSNTGGATNYGNEFYSDNAGTISQIAFYKGSADTGTHVAAIYDKTSGSQLASVTFSSETSSGWQYQALTTPLAITAATHYVVAIRSPAGKISASNGTPPVPSTGLHVVGTTKYDYNGSLDLPTANTSSSIWAVDIGFQAAGATPNTAMTNPMTTAGDLITGGSGGASTRLPAGASNTLLGGGSSPAFTVAPTVSGEMTASDFKPSGLTGATAATRFVGGTTTSHPTSGTFALGDYVITQDASVWVCTTAGSPGTWTQIAGGSSTLAGDTDVSISSPVGGQVLGYSSALSKWVNQNVAGVAATTTTSVVGSDVTMTSAFTFYDGPSVSLPAGTWLLTGAVTVEMTSSGSDITAKLWDGTTVYASGEALCAGGTGAAQVDVTAVVSPTATTTYKISAAVQQTGGLIKASTNANASAKASYLTAIQLSGNPVGQQAPAVHAYNTGSLTVPNNVETAIPLDSTRFDQGTTTSQHSTSSNTSRLTCQQAGIYTITGQIAWNGTYANSEVRIRLNGSTDIASQRVGSGTGMSVNVVYQLAAGDYVEMTAYQNSGGNGTIFGSTTIPNYGTEFMMARIDSGPGAVQPNTKVQLDWAASTDIGVTALSATTWTDVFTAQSFTVDDVSSVVEIAACGLVLVGNGGTIQTCSARLNIDSGATTKIVSGCRAPSSDYANILSGSTPVEITGLSAGSHTVKLQIYGEAGTNYLCQASTHPNVQGLGLRVLERKQSVSPPSSTPAPAVRVYNSSNSAITASTLTALTFNTNRFDQGTSTAQHSTSSNTSRLVCQQSGIYYIAGNIQWSGSPSTNETDLIIRLNGTTTIGQWQNVGTDQRRMAVSTLYQLNVGDYVELIVYTGASGLSVQSDGNDSPEFMMARVDSGGQGFVPIPMVKTASYIILNTDSMIVAGANSLTFTLPACSSRAPGMPLVIKNDNFTGTTLSRAGSDTIDDATSYVLSAAYASVTLVGDGSSKWRII